MPLKKTKIQICGVQFGKIEKQINITILFESIIIFILKRNNNDTLSIYNYLGLSIQRPALCGNYEFDIINNNFLPTNKKKIMITILCLSALFGLAVYLSDRWAQQKLYNDHLHAENRRIMRIIRAKTK